MQGHNLDLSKAAKIIAENYSVWIKFMRTAFQTKGPIFGFDSNACFCIQYLLSSARPAFTTFLLSLPWKETANTVIYSAKEYNVFLARLKDTWSAAITSGPKDRVYLWTAKEWESLLVSKLFA